MAKETEPVKFVSKYQSHTLCMIPQRTKVTEGLLEVVPGEHIRFENGEYTTDEPRKLKFLRGHKFYGTSITEV